MFILYVQLGLPAKSKVVSVGLESASRVFISCGILNVEIPKSLNFTIYKQEKKKK